MQQVQSSRAQCTHLWEVNKQCILVRLHRLASHAHNKISKTRPVSYEYYGLLANLEAMLSSIANMSAWATLVSPALFSRKRVVRD